MKSKERLTLQELLTRKVTIPPIQRDYAFGRKNSEGSQKRINFVSNLAKVINGELGKLHLDFVYGQRIGASFVPLDGQQRITTLWLLSVYLSRKNHVKDVSLENFTYATRTSTREFCASIIKEVWDPNQASEAYFQKQKWFFNSWRFDPTISGMLVMLEEIHRQLPNGGNYENCSLITFSFLDVEELGQPEELYVKMNSRGKQLSDWDNFKAELFELSVSVKYKKWIDMQFLDFFWNLGLTPEDRAANTENRMFRFFYLNLFMKRLIASDTETTATEIVDYIDLNWNKMIDEKFLESIKHFISLIKSHGSDIKSFKSDRFKESIRFNELMEILRMTDSRDGLVANLDLFFAYWTYLGLAEQDSFNIEELFDVVRISTNLEESYRKDVEITRTSLKAFKPAIEWKDGILDYFANQDLTSVSFGARSEEQKNEEIVKARLLLEDDADIWESVLYIAESNGYLKGTVGWLLRLSNEEHHSFCNFYHWFSDNFDDNGIKDKTKIAQMLKYSDIRMNRFFPKNNGDVSGSYRDWSWKRYFREHGYKNNKENLLDITWIKELVSNKVVNESARISKLEKWRQWLIDYPDILNYVGAVDVWGEAIIGLRWRVKVFSSNKFSLPIIAAREYIGGFEYSGNMDSTQNLVVLNKSGLTLSFDNTKEEFVISNETAIKATIPTSDIAVSIDSLKKRLNELQA